MSHTPEFPWKPTTAPTPDGRRRRVAVIGAGAAGTMAAIFAAQSGAETVLIERTKDGGRKILISGGGRCNILPATLDESRFVTDSSPNTLRKIVRSWPLQEQIAFFESELGLELVEETESNKLFPASHRARDVRDGLIAYAERQGARFIPNTLVTGITPHPGGHWRLTLDGAAAIDTDAVIIATGGLSVPNTGSDGTGLRIAGALGHTIHSLYPALTPLIAEPAPFAALSGVSLTVTITAQSAERSATATGGFLFTHHGYSGPAALNVSHVASRAPANGNAPAQLFVQWTALTAPEWERALQPHGNRTVLGALRAVMPDRLAGALLDMAAVDPTRSLADLRRNERLDLIETLVRGRLPWTSDDGYKKAEVTGGGVNLAEIDPRTMDPRTMESRNHSNLFLCGEVLDAFGPIGGYNFLWAWATGRAAGIGAARSRL
jgi:predicted Rossmann fold flavoprotein